VVEKPTPILKELFKTSDDMLKREYTISQHEKVWLWSREIFPLSYFK
jgi:chorismate-pyruvate lyase